MGMKRRILLVLALLPALLLFFVSAVAASSGEEVQAASLTNDAGLGLLAAGLVTGLAGIGGGIAVAAAAPAAIRAAAEDPAMFGRSLIFVALGESIALYGVVIAILILQGLGML